MSIRTIASPPRMHSASAGQRESPTTPRNRSWNAVPSIRVDSPGAKTNWAFTGRLGSVSGFESPQPAMRRAIATSGPIRRNIITRLLAAGFERRAAHRLAPQQRDAAAVVGHVEKTPRELLHREGQRLDTHRNPRNI